MNQQKLAIDSLLSRGLDIPLNEAQRQAWQERFNNLPAMRYSGTEIDISHPRLIKVILPAIELHHQGGLGGSAANGAVIAGMFDCAIGVAGSIQFSGQRTGTVELSVKLLRPATEAPLIAYTVATKKSAAIAFAESVLFSGDQLSAQCTGLVGVSTSQQVDPDSFLKVPPK